LVKVFKRNMDSYSLRWGLITPVASFSNCRAVLHNTQV
jgi:hypothetical protein